VSKENYLEVFRPLLDAVWHKPSVSWKHWLAAAPQQCPTLSRTSRLNISLTNAAAPLFIRCGPLWLYYISRGEEPLALPKNHFQKCFVQ
jgi:hypothetical protein